MNIGSDVARIATQSGLVSRLGRVRCGASGVATLSTVGVAREVVDIGSPAKKALNDYL